MRERELNDMLTMGEVREQSALLNRDEVVFVKLGDQIYTAKRCYPDTEQAQCGRGLYLEVIEVPVTSKRSSAW